MLSILDQHNAELAASTRELQKIVLAPIARIVVEYGWFDHKPVDPRVIDVLIYYMGDISVRFGEIEVLMEYHGECMRTCMPVCCIDMFVAGGVVDLASRHINIGSFYSLVLNGYNDEIKSGLDDMIIGEYLARRLRASALSIVPGVMRAMRAEILKCAENTHE